MSIISSVAESYMFADMYNRDYGGGSAAAASSAFYSDNAQDGGSEPEFLQTGGFPLQTDGPLANLVVPVGIYGGGQYPKRKVDYSREYLANAEADKYAAAINDARFDALFARIAKPDKSGRVSNRLSKRNGLINRTRTKRGAARPKLD